MELKKGFADFLSEAKDVQKAKENADMTKNDASNGEKSTTLDPKVKGDGNTYEGDKADNLDPSINEATSPSQKKKAEDVAKLHSHIDALEKTIKSSMTPASFKSTAKTVLDQVKKELDDLLAENINEDAQKAKENADMKKNDASHGEKATVVKEGDEKGKVLHGEKECDDEDGEGKLDESLSSTERDIIKDNISRKRGEHVLIKGKEDSETFIVHAASSSITYVKHASGNVMIYSLDRSGKNVIYLDDEDITFINKNV